MDLKSFDQLNRAITHIVSSRMEQIAVREAADTQIKALTKQLYVAMVDADCKRTQLVNGTTVSIVEPKPRLTIKGEKLLAMGVDPDKIRAATVETPVDPYVRVDAPKGDAAHATSPASGASADDSPITH